MRSSPSWRSSCSGPRWCSCAMWQGRAHEIEPAMRRRLDTHAHLPAPRSRVGRLRRDGAARRRAIELDIACCAEAGWASGRARVAGQRGRSSRPPRPSSTSPMLRCSTSCCSRCAVARSSGRSRRPAADRSITSSRSRPPRWVTTSAWPTTSPTPWTQSRRWVLALHSRSPSSTTRVCWRSRDDEAQARSMLTEARAVFVELGMTAHVVRADDRRNASPRDLSRSRAPEATNSARKARCGGSGSRARPHSSTTARECADIAYLLARPGQDVHVLDLAAPRIGTTDSIAESGDELLDAPGDAALYKARIIELEDDLTEAERLADDDTCGMARAERDLLVDELSCGNGPRRPRPAADRSRRAGAPGGTGEGPRRHPQDAAREPEARAPSRRVAAHRILLPVPPRGAHRLGAVRARPKPPHIVSREQPHPPDEGGVQGASHERRAAHRGRTARHTPRRRRMGRRTCEASALAAEVPARRAPSTRPSLPVPALGLVALRLRLRCELPRPRRADLRRRPVLRRARPHGRRRTGLRRPRDEPGRRRRHVLPRSAIEPLRQRPDRARPLRERNETCRLKSKRPQHNERPRPAARGARRERNRPLGAGGGRRGGVVFVAIQLTIGGILGGMPGVNARPSVIRDYVLANDGEVLVAATLSAGGAFLFIWFLGQLARSAPLGGRRRLEPELGDVRCRHRDGRARHDRVPSGCGPVVEPHCGIGGRRAR